MNLETEFHPCPKPTKKRKPSKARAKEFSPNTKDTVRERSQGVCEICHQRRAIHFHHAVFRSHTNGEEAKDISNCLYLCHVCHDVCHSTKAMREYAVELAQQLASGQADGS